MWTFTGGCHYSGTCVAYKDQCGNCPFIKKPVKNDLSRFIWEKKKKMLNRTNIHFVTCSEWLRDVAKDSSLLKEESVDAIPNSIDTTLFQPLDKRRAKEQLGLNPDKTYLLFGALNVTDERKGFKYFKEAVTQLVKLLEHKVDVELFGFWQSPTRVKGAASAKSKRLGVGKRPQSNCGDI